MTRPYRVGQIVPSSNVTMETEIPEIFRAREKHYDDRFTFHSSRMRMKQVTKEELASMDRDSDRCVLELSDASMDVMGYACLVAIMSVGLGYHRESQARLRQITVDNGHPCPVVSSAGGLVEGLSTLNAKRIAVIAPYRKPSLIWSVSILSLKVLRFWMRLVWKFLTTLRLHGKILWRQLT